MFGFGTSVCIYVNIIYKHSKKFYDRGRYSEKGHCLENCRMVSYLKLCAGLHVKSNLSGLPLRAGIHCSSGVL